MWDIQVISDTSCHQSDGGRLRHINYTLSNVDAGETGPTPVTTVLSLQNLMDANKFLVLFNVI